MDLGFLSEVIKPTRYTGGEVNETVKSDRDDLLHVALAFPDGYEIAMSTMGLKILYGVLNARSDIWAERVFMPMPDMIEVLDARDLPLFALESKRPLDGFDVVGFTLQFELTYTNILHMLRMGRVPVRSCDRDESHPVILAGGPCACNPEPLAPFVDAFFIGDGEEGFLDLCDVVKKMRGAPRKDVLLALTGVEGTYVPALYRTEQDPETGMEVVAGPTSEDVPFPVRRRVLLDIDRYPFPSDVLVPHHEVVHDRYSIEIARGCSVGCRFCQAGYIYRPQRDRDPKTVRKTVREGLKSTGFNEVTLLSLNAGEYKGVENLVTRVSEDGASQQVGVAMPSLRVSSLTEELVSSLSSGRKSGFTIAPEAGTQRLRNVVNKKIDDADLALAAEALYGAGWNLVKLYFMLGLPTETEEDVEAIAKLAAMVVARGREAGCRNPKVTVSTSSFVPKPFTPFQWCPMAPRAVLEERQGRLKRMLRNPVTYRWHDIDASVVEGAFSLGDRRLAGVLEEAVRLGCRFDGWNEYFRADLWARAFDNAGVSMGEYLYRERGRDERLPWDVIDIGVRKSALWKEWEKAQAGETTETCGPEACYACGFYARECLGGSLAKEADAGPAAPPRAPKTPAFARYRLRYRKEGPARFLGHLDLVDALVRAFRRCNVVLAYSQGYHPMPKVVLPAPLPLGVAGAEEWVDFTGYVGDRERLLRDLCENLPSGLVPDRLFTIPANAPPLSELTVQEYRIGLSGLDPEARAACGKNLESFLRAETWPVSKNGKKKSRTYDLKERVLKVGLEGDSITLDLDRGGFMDFVSVLSPEGRREGLDLTRTALKFGIRDVEG